MKMRHPNNIKLKLNMATALFEIGENGIVYAMPMELTTPIKKYFRYYDSLNSNDDRTVAAWYKALANEDKKKVERSGNVPKDDNGFYPDSSFEESDC